MNYGFNIAASGVLTAMYRQDVAANNLANIETIGFKEDLAATVTRDAARAEDGLWNLPSNTMLEKLGGGVLLAPTRTLFTQGVLQTTGNELDLAIKGEGFFMVSVGRGKGGSEAARLRFTRDGRFTLNSEGVLVTAAGGHPVLDETDRPIHIRPGQPVSVGGDGVITQGDHEVARLKYTDVPDRKQLHKEGESLFSASSATMGSRRPAVGTGEIVQKAVERSVVDPIKAMMAVQDAANAVAMNARVMQIHDDLMGRAINTLGRVV